MRRTLVLADVVGLSLAFSLTFLLFAADRGPGSFSAAAEILLFVVTLPAWLLLSAMHHLYDHDLERAEHSTIDELVGVVQTVTIGTWIFLAIFLMFGWVTDTTVLIGRLFTFWALAIVLVGICRAAGRTAARRSPAYTERTLLLGAGDVGQLIARKIQLHPEYGLRLVGFVDSDPRARRSDVSGVALRGSREDLDQVVRDLEVDRVIVAFSREPDEETMQTLRAMRDRNIAIDVVPRLFDLIGPHSSLHTVEGLPLVNVSPLRLSRMSFLIKRACDILAASVLLALTLPLFAYVAIRIRLDSPGPVFFRQTRLAMDMKPFTVLKFRSMAVDTDETVHRDFVQTREIVVGERWRLRRVQVGT